MNIIQLKLIEIAKEYIKVCEKLNLRYFAIGGTCLGAIRHNGFVPWDDDMDFGMPRKDYDIFQKEAQKYLPVHLFLQNHATDHNFYQKYSKIRNSNTTAIEYGDAELNINHGLWIDIFPLDGLPEEKLLKKYYFKEFKIYRRRFLHYKYNYSSLKNKIANILVLFAYPSKEKTFKKSVALSKKYNFDESEFIWRNNCFVTNIKKEWFDSYIEMKFEDIVLRVPNDYVAYLESIFGNWKALPSLEKRINPHKFKVLDLQTPYSAYYCND